MYIILSEMEADEDMEFLSTSWWLSPEKLVCSVWDRTARLESVVFDSVVVV